MAEDSGQSVISALEAHVLPLVPGLAEQLAAGISVLDVGCGSGRIMMRLAQLYPNSQFTGMALSPEAIAGARAEAAAQGVPNIQFVVRDVSDRVALRPLSATLYRVGKGIYAYQSRLALAAAAAYHNDLSADRARPAPGPSASPPGRAMDRLDRL
jgi:SAM-dependent methyltransferase